VKIVQETIKAGETKLSPLTELKPFSILEKGFFYGQNFAPNFSTIFEYDYLSIPILKITLGAFIMIMTTTNNLDKREVKTYLGIVTGEAILGANIFRDFFAGIRDIVGGRSGAYEKELQSARKIAFEEMEMKANSVGANAIIGIDLDYETIGANGSMLMVTVSGTAVIAE
jgi:uncharacterized protein YbjQ (UPF0145 family)